MKKLLYVTLIAVVLSLTVAVSRSGLFSLGPFQGLNCSALIGSILYFIFTYLCLRKLSPSVRQVYIVLSILAGSYLLESIALLLPGKMHDLFSLELFTRCLSVFCALLIYNLRPRWVKIGITSVHFALMVWIILVGSGYVLNYSNFGSFTGKVHTRLEEPFSFQTPDGEAVDLSRFNASYVIIDCWNTYCGICYQKFPRFQQLYDRFTDDPEVEVIALHLRNNKDETPATGADILRERGYSFPCYSMGGENKERADIHLKVVPTVLIFSSDHTLIFKGNLEGAEKYLGEILGKPSRAD